MNLVEARIYFRGMGQLLRTEFNRNERRRLLEETRKESLYQEAFTILRQGAQLKKADTFESEVKKSRGLSEKLTSRLPHLEIRYGYCSVWSTCDLRKGQPIENCIQMTNVLTSSIYTNNSLNITEIDPMPAGCKACPLTKAS